MTDARTTMAEDDLPVVVLEEGGIRYNQGRKVKQGRDTRGMSLEDLSDYGIISSTILARLREAHAIGRAVAGLKLFGPDADIEASEGDGCVIQLFKEHARLYRRAQDEGDTKAMREVLTDMTKLTLGWQGKEEQTLAHCVKIQIEAARLKARQGKSEEWTEAELTEQAGG
jgi:hypothetical protein